SSAFDRAQDRKPSHPNAPDRNERSTVRWTPEQIDTAAVRALHREVLDAFSVPRVGPDREKTSNVKSRAALDHGHGREERTPPEVRPEEPLNSVSRADITFFSNSVLSSFGQRSADHLKSTRTEEIVHPAPQRSSSTAVRAQRGPRPGQAGDPLVHQDRGGRPAMRPDERVTVRDLATQHRSEAVTEPPDSSLVTPLP